MTDDDRVKLERPGLRRDYDLRTTAEVDKQPEQVPFADGLGLDTEAQTALRALLLGVRK